MVLEQTIPIPPPFQTVLCSTLLRPSPPAAYGQRRELQQQKQTHLAVDVKERESESITVLPQHHPPVARSTQRLQ